MCYRKSGSCDRRALCCAISGAISMYWSMRWKNDLGDTSVSVGGGCGLFVCVVVVPVVAGCGFLVFLLVEKLNMVFMALTVVGLVDAVVLLPVVAVDLVGKPDGCGACCLGLGGKLSSTSGDDDMGVCSDTGVDDNSPLSSPEEAMGIGDDVVAGGVWGEGGKEGEGEGEELLGCAMQSTSILITWSASEVSRVGSSSFSTDNAALNSAVTPSESKRSITRSTNLFGRVVIKRQRNHFVPNVGIVMCIVSVRC